MIRVSTKLNIATEYSSSIFK